MAARLWHAWDWLLCALGIGVLLLTCCCGLLVGVYVRQGYSLSFLITNFHVEDMKKQELVNFIIQFMQDVNAEVSELKLAVNSRARVVAHTFLKQFC